MPALPITRVVLYKHGVGYFERQGKVQNDSTLSLTFKQVEVSDVLKSLTVLDLDGGHIASVSYDSTKPLEQLLSEVAISIPDQNSLVTLLPQIKGVRVSLHTGVSEPVEGIILGIDTTDRQTGEGVVKVVLISVVTDSGEVRSFDLHQLAGVKILDPVLRRDLDYYLKTQLSAKKKDARTFTFFAQGEGERSIRLSYTLEAPVWKATYRILLGEESKSPMIQGWAVVDNTQDEDWENVKLSLIAGLPVSFVHDLYTPRYIRRPEVHVQETTGVLPPVMEMAMDALSLGDEMEYADEGGGRGEARKRLKASAAPMMAGAMMAPMAKQDKGKHMQSSTPAQVRERKIGDLFEYEIEHPVTIRRNQSALVPIVLKSFDGRPVLLYNKQNRADNPMRCVEFKNTTGLTLEGGPITVLEAGSYVGEAMLETVKPDEDRLIPYAVELSVHVLDNINSHQDQVHRVVIRNGQMTMYRVQVQQTTYSLNNKSDEEQIVYLEHPRQHGEWKLFDTVNPKEVTENYWRFRFVLPAKKTTQFLVKQQFPAGFNYSLWDLSDQQMSAWVSQRYLDAKTEKVLRDVIQLRNQAGQMDGLIAQLQKERETIHQEQNRIRQNLQSLGDRTTEKDLRERFVRTLNQQEDRLELIEKETQAKVKERDQLREKLNQTLAKLEFETDVS